MADAILPQNMFEALPSSESLGLIEAFPLVYDELYKLASGSMRREREPHTLQPTALIHEAYLRLRSQHGVEFGNRAQLLGVAAQLMRRILSTREEKRHAGKRGNDFAIVRIGDATEPAAPTVVIFSDVDDVLNRLAALDDRQAKIAELRIFGGLTAEEIGECLHVSAATVNRDWASAKVWLARELKASQSLLKEG